MIGKRAVGEPRGFASLSSSLLARKGTAKPAMRPQGFGQMTGTMDDLGWNDMGSVLGNDHGVDVADHVPSRINALTPPPRTAPEAPVVVEQQRSIAQTFGEKDDPVEVPAPVELPRVAANAVPGKAKAAFTLRLDPDRHLRLRLASAVARRSAQQLVCEALDRFLDSMPEVDSLARQVPGKAGKNS